MWQHCHNGVATLSEIAQNDWKNTKSLTIYVASYVIPFMYGLFNDAVSS